MLITITEPESFFDCFSSLPDPRKDINKKHLMIDIIFITVCAVISGVTSWEQIEDFAIDREEWLRKYISLPNGIPSHDTIRYLFLFLNENAFNKAFAEWVKMIKPKLEDMHIAIDGKTNRRSGNKNKTLKPLHNVTAFATGMSLALGQVHVDEKSNEITAIPELLDMLEIKGCFITIDAMGCQKDIAQKIDKDGGTYILAVKGNQKNLHEEISDYFEDALATNFKDINFKRIKTVENDHGRLEDREYYITSDIEDLFETKKWSGLSTIAMVVAKRKIDGKTTIEKRFYISNCKKDNEKIAKYIRGHWGIENSFHWVLDMDFNEDQCRKRMKNSAKNIATVRKIALNMLKNEKTYKASIKSKILKAARNTDYLENVLGI